MGKLTVKIRLEKIVSGGQTGADRAGLDAAMKAGLPVGGYCPKGRLAEDGTVPEHYPLVEMTKGGYSARTELNVVESDGTVVFNIGKLTGGTRLTVECARKHNKPHIVIQLDVDKPDVTILAEWIDSNNIMVLNVAGPRESKTPGVHRLTCKYLEEFFKITYCHLEEGL
jgi:predicted Rossmann fold nucleotide-binding protein DprA/Smf involved in DNA uptake